MHSNQSREYLSTCRNSQLFILILIKFFIRDNQKYKEAEQFYTKAKLLDEHNSNIFCDFGECLGFFNLLSNMIRQQMQIEKALIEFDQALRIDANYPQAAFYKGVLLIYQGIWRVLIKREDEKLIKEEIFKYFQNITFFKNDTYVSLFKALLLKNMVSLTMLSRQQKKFQQQRQTITRVFYQKVSCQLIITIFNLYLVSNNLAYLYNYLDRQQSRTNLQYFLRVYVQSYQFTKKWIFSLEQYNDAIKLLDSILEFDSNNQNVQLIKGQCLISNNTQIFEQWNLNNIKKLVQYFVLFWKVILITQLLNNTKINVQKYINIIIIIETIQQETEAIQDLELKI